MDVGRGGLIICQLPSKMKINCFRGNASEIKNSKPAKRDSDPSKIYDISIYSLAFKTFFKNKPLT